MTIIKMNQRYWIISIITLLLVAITTNASDPSSIGSTDFQLIDLTALLGSLNLTYEDLGINPSNLTSMAAASGSSSANSSPVTSNTSPAITNNLSNSQSPNSITSTTTTASNPSLSGQTTSNSATNYNSKDTQSSEKAKPTSTDSGKNSIQIIVPNKQLTVSPQNTKNNEIKNTDIPSSLSTNTPSSTASVPSPSISKNVPPAVSSSQQSGSTGSSISNGNINSPPTIGPGPTDPNLPPVLDFSKMVVSTNLLTPSQTTASKQGTTSTNVNTAIAANSEGSPKPSSQTQTSSQNSNAPQNTKIDQSKATQLGQQKSPTTIARNPPSNPVPQTSTPARAPQQLQTISSVPSIVPTKTDGSSSQMIAGQYQYFSSTQEAIYSLTPSYKSFFNYFIISTNDPFLPRLQEYLFRNYGNYLNNGELIVGLRLYNSDGSLDYQLLYNTNYGTFTSIMTFQPDNARIQLKTLSILNFFIMQIDYPNCQQQNAEQKNCRICKEGFRNFMGRCKPYDQFCVKYSAEECTSCSNGKALSSGYCR